MQTSLFQRGLTGSSFGGAALGQLQAQGASEALHAGEDLYQNRLNQTIQRRGALNSLSGNLATTSEQNALARNQSVMQAAQDAINAHNQFDLNNFDNYFKAQQLEMQRNAQLAQNFNTAGSFAAGAAGAIAPYAWDAAKRIGGGIGNFFNPSNNNSKYPYVPGTASGGQMAPINGKLPYAEPPGGMVY